MAYHKRSFGDRTISTKILAMYRAGADVKAIAKAVGKSAPVIYSYLANVQSEGVVQTNRPKTDCFVWDQKQKQCTALTELFCRTKESCPFYKSRLKQAPDTIEMITGGMK